MNHFKRSNLALSAIIACVLITSCGGDGAAPAVSNGPTNPTIPVESTFPTGLAVASPSDVSTTPATSSGQVHVHSVAAHAVAADADRFELKSLSAIVQQVLNGDSSVDLD